MAAAGRNGPHGEPFIWLLRVGSLIKDTPSNWICFLPGVRGVWGFKTPDYCCDVSLRHHSHSSNRAFQEHTPTHSWQKADQIEIGRVSLASNRRTGAEKNATNGHTGNDKATTTRIAAINVDVMMTATVLTVGARRRCPRTQEHRRGSGVAPDPDKWLTMRTVSAGGGHGPNLLGKSEAGGGGQLR
jgi:hypothetical protein